MNQRLMAQNNAGVYQNDQGLSTDSLTLARLPNLVKRVVASNPPHVWLLSGPLGAGKTTFVQVLGRYLGVRGDITSPTFALQKIHPLRGQPWDSLVHLDAYRISNLSEAAALELPEHLANPRSLVVIEWPERLKGLTWGRHLVITLAPGRVAHHRQVRVELV